jgi:TonB dependent receptor
MRRKALLLAALALLLCGQSAASAQAPRLSEGIHFSLKPRAGRPMPRLPAPSDTRTHPRMSRLVAVPVHDRAQEIEIVAKRQKFVLVRTGRLPHEAPPPAFGPRSRFILLMLQDRAIVGDDLIVTVGVQGTKLSNRSANVTTIASNDRVRARDWFLPRATLEIAPLPHLDAAIDYRETLRGYGETGRSGPMALRHDEFRALLGALRPETHRRLRIDARWTPSPNTVLKVTAYGGRLHDRLAFVDRSYRPRNGGSAHLMGWRVAMSHALSPDWRVSLHYGEDQLDQVGGGRATEASLSAEAGWSSGPWTGSLRAARTSAPALLADPGRGGHLRLEREVRYQIAKLGLMPAVLTLRLADPDRLATSDFLRDDPAGPVHATDQARSLMLGVGLNW